MRAGSSAESLAECAADSPLELTGLVQRVTNEHWSLSAEALRLETISLSLGAQARSFTDDSWGFVEQVQRFDGEGLQDYGRGRSLAGQARRFVSETRAVEAES